MIIPEYDALYLLSSHNDLSHIEFINISYLACRFEVFHQKSSLCQYHPFEHKFGVECIELT